MIISCLLVSSSVQLGRIASANGTVVVVPSVGIATIQEGINQANSGDIVFIKTGVYVENIELNKSVSLVGEDRDATIIDGNATFTGYGYVIFITVSGASVSNLTIRNSGIGFNDAGIRIQETGGNSITDNKLTDNGDGIAAYNSENIVISGNLVTKNNNNGVNLHSSVNSVVSRNVVTENYAGIYLASCANNSISANQISQNVDGIYLTNSTGDVIFANVIDGSSLYGIQMDSSCSGNTVYHNDMWNTGNAASDAMNFWDYGGEGNYWSDYDGKDSDQDGIGDTPYNLKGVSGNPNIDNYPLMGTFTPIDFKYNGTDYHASIISNSSISGIEFNVLIGSHDRMLTFDTNGTLATSGFVRIQLPNGAMDPLTRFPNGTINSPYIVFTDSQEITPKVLSESNDTYTFLYFGFSNNNDTVTIVASESLHLYNDLLLSYDLLREDLSSLNGTYVDLTSNYAVLQDNFSSLQSSLERLTTSYDSLLALNESTGQYREYYLGLMSDFNQLQMNYTALSNSYQNYLIDYTVQVQNLRNLIYIFAATTAVFLVTTVYLSWRAYSIVKPKRKRSEETKDTESD